MSQKTYRYNIGPPSLQAAAFRVYISLVFAIFWLANAVTALRFLQVCVWKRVKEFNEDLLHRAITRVVLLVCGVQGCLCNPEYKLFAAISGITQAFFVRTIFVQNRKWSPFLELTPTLRQMPRDVTNISED